jgi:putative DNA primase/helicase
VTTAAYDPAAYGPQWSKFLQRVQPDEEMRRFLARLIGHALEGRVVAHILPIFYGQGANGKGTFIAAVLHALGDYADAADPDLLTARTFDAHPTSVADLFGMRLAVLHEGDAGRRLAEGTDKRLTGGDRVKARRMREDYWSFEPSHTFLVLTNHKPIEAGTDEGIWRRLRLVPWDVVVPEAERDLDLADRLTLEADAVLAWTVAGYREWRGLGLADPEAPRPVERASRRIRSMGRRRGRRGGQSDSLFHRARQPRIRQGPRSRWGRPGDDLAAHRFGHQRRGGLSYVRVCPRNCAGCAGCAGSIG